MLRTRGIITKFLCRKYGGAAVLRCHGRRWMVGKAANRAAVHGAKLPVPNAIPVEEVEMEIHKSIEDREKKRREIENTLDSKLKNWPMLYIEQLVCSK
ncbi:hypothetical protein C2S52_003800 [Perilla frutescens var. hirtella]|nr:hypothetical protein C2S51_011727 [Perilla frutescens var. frutescens]KAH6793323.1 hypothetical protein C2S52_003800 [Perilla frutescens var. hirtella]